MNEPDPARYERNLAAIAKRFPELGEALEAMGEPKSRITGSVADGTLNLDVGHTQLYAGGAVAFAEAQIERFQRDPQRIYMDPPVRNDPPGEQQYFTSEALYAWLGDRELPHRPPTPTLDDGGFMLVYGIGLGLHLPMLFAEAPVRHFIVAEEHLEFVRHSLSLIDWEEILDRLREAGQTLHFIVGPDPGVMAGRIHWYLRGRTFGLIDGSYIFRHYVSTVLDEAHRDFVKNLPLLAVSIGFFEDELVMLDHATRNLLNRRFRYFELKPRLHKDVPAFIVGSGPSLDRTIEQIKSYAGQAVIFSSGTALLPLLRNGIRPDFQCELENGWNSVLHLQRTRSEFDLSGITLIASTTVHPEMSGMFDDTIFYFRDSVVSTPLWCPDGLGIHGTAPTCTNLALRAALGFAFREIYLFGVDLGTRRAGEHHSKHAIYKDVPEWLHTQVHDPLKIMNIAMPGNFGGTAYTNQILHWARMMMVQSLEAFSYARIYNCCDGVSVPGTWPKLAQSVRVTTTPERKAAILRRLRSEIVPKEPGEMVPYDRLADARAALAHHYTAMRAVVAASRADGRGFIPFYDAMLELLDLEPQEPFRTVERAVNIGTLMMCFQIGYYFYRRVPEDEQQAVMRIFLDSLDGRLAVMAETVDRLAGSLESLYDAPPDALSDG